MKRILTGGLIAVLAAAGAWAEEEAKADGFSTALNVGLTLTDGNSDTMTLNASVVTEGEKEGLGSVLAGIEGNYGESTVDGVEETTVENIKGYVNIKKTLSPKTYAYVDTSALYDDVAGIDYRVTLGPGLGFYALKTDQRSLSLEAGPTYVWERVAALSDEEPPVESYVKDDYLALRVAQRYVCQVLENAKLVQTLEYLPDVEDFDNYLLNFEAGIEAAMNDHLSLRLVVQNKYDNTPADGRERNDVSVLAGLSFSL